jgi:hypothetical protein
MQQQDRSHKSVSGFSQADELVRREHLGVTIAQGLRCYEKAVLTSLDATHC